MSISFLRNLVIYRVKCDQEAYRPPKFECGFEVRNVSLLTIYEYDIAA